MSMTYKEMSETPLFEGLTEKQIRNKARALGLSKTRSLKNTRLFKNIDTVMSAYWLGFIYADGNIQCNRDISYYELSIELQKCDSHILDLLNQEFGGFNEVKNRTRIKELNGYTFSSDTSFIRIFNKDICKDLVYQGVKPNKTYLEEHPSVDNDELFFHFLRGFLDGDGCIYLHRSGFPQVSFTNSNAVFLEYLNSRVKELLDIEGSIYKENDLKFKLIFFRKCDTLKLLKNIYKDSNKIYLERKFEIYDKYNGSLD